MEHEVLRMKIFHLLNRPLLDQPQVYFKKCKKYGRTAAQHEMAALNSNQLLEERGKGRQAVNQN